MQEEHVARAKPARKAREHAPRVGAPRVEAAPRPGHVAQAAAREHEIEQRAAKARRRAKEVRRAAGKAGCHLLRGLDLAAHAPDAEAGKGVRMAGAVGLDAVAAARGLAHDLWVCGRPLGDAEEACPGVMAIPPVENARCDPRIWAVVESQPDLAAPGGLV